MKIINPKGGTHIDISFVFLFIIIDLFIILFSEGLQFFPMCDSTG